MKTCVRCGTAENLYLHLGKTDKVLCRSCATNQDAIWIRRQRKYDEYADLCERFRRLRDEVEQLERHANGLRKPEVVWVTTNSISPVSALCWLTGST